MHQSPETLRKIEAFSNSGKLPLRLRGRDFSLEDIQTIHQCTDLYFERGRTCISQAICERLDWRQPNGWLKDRACRDVLRSLSELGIIELPPLKTVYKPDRKLQPIPLMRSETLVFGKPVESFPKNIELVFAKGNPAEAVWNKLVDTYHYLGHRVAVGRSIKYLINSEFGLLGAISFSSASWRIKARDELLQKLGFPVDVHRDIVVNNSRFLILPHVVVNNLASRVLSMATRQVVVDWSRYYSIEPQLAETFVEPSRFAGTCYKAANWSSIGITKGYAKKGSSYHNSQEPKFIYIYGLNRRVRHHLQSLLMNS